MTPVRPDEVHDRLGAPLGDLALSRRARVGGSGGGGGVVAEVEAARQQLVEDQRGSAEV
jgi:hypothetical protein